MRETAAPRDPGSRARQHQRSGKRAALARPPLRQLRHVGRPSDPIPEGASALTVKRSDALYRRALSVADVVALATALAIAVAVGRPGASAWLILMFPLLVVVNKAVGLYDRDQYLLCRTTLDEGPTIFQVATLFALLAWLTQELSAASLTAGQVALLWGLLFIGLLCTRTLARRAVRGIVPEERCLVVGDVLAAERLRRKIAESRSANARVVGMVPLCDRRNGDGPIEHPDRRQPRSGPPALGRMETLGLVLVEQDVHHVIFVPRHSASEDILDVIRVIKALGVKVSVLPGLIEVVGSAVEIDDVDGLPLMALKRRSLSRSSAILKRALDLTVAGGAMVILAPFVALIALAIKLDSPGPVLFRQRRIGRHGRQFELAKFRTMVVGADAMKPNLNPLNEGDGLFKISRDPRTTRLGRLLRSTHLDELPQLLNVLRGEMSLIGPRPLIPDEDMTIEGWDRNRLNLSPGMTGYWQILGGPRIPLKEMVKIDHWYVTNWSIWLDIKILLRTVPHVLGRRGL